MKQGSEKTVTIKQGAERLNVCEATVRKLCKSGTLPAVRVGRKWVIPEAKFSEFLGVDANE